MEYKYKAFISYRHIAPDMQAAEKLQWMHGTEEAVLKKIRKDSFAYGLASLEHRRWCCYMASIGWRPGERSDQFRRNPCLVPQQKLMQEQPEMCKYDLMSLMERYKKRTETEIK